MDVAMPIRSVSPSLDGPVLAVLAGTSRPVGLTEIRRLAGGRGSLSGIRRVVLRLVSSGLVDAVPGGYVLNREHIAAPAVEQLARLHGELADRIRVTIREWPGEALLAGIFGSVARRDGDERSDIDILVISDSPGLDDLVDILAERVPRWTGNEAQVIGRTTADLRRLRSLREPLLNEWERDLIVLEGDRRVLGAAA